MRNHMIKEIMVGISFLFILFPVLMYGAVPQYISFQGKLVEDGDAITGDRDITFSIWANDTGGNPASALWSETQAVTVTKGIYNVELGSVTPLPGDLYENDDLFLQLDIVHPTEGTQRLSPLMPFNSHVFALKAANADEADHAADADTTDYATFAGTATSATTADTATYAMTADYATSAGSATSATSADYATSAGDADTVDGEHASAFAYAAHEHDATDITTGTLSTGRYSARSDLSAEGYLGNASGDIAQNNGTLQSSLNADLLDGLSSGAFLTTISDYGRSGVSSTLYEGTTPLIDKYVNETGDSMSAASSGFLLTVTNTGTGSGILVNDGYYSYYSSNASTSLYSYYPTYDGAYIYAPGDDGVEIRYAGYYGLWVYDSTYDGVAVSYPGTNGVEIYSPGDWGVHVYNAGLDGFYAESPTDFGLFVTNGLHGAYIYEPGADGVYVINSGDDGLQIDAPSDNGVEINDPTWWGVRVDNAGWDGFYADSPGYYGLYVTDAGSYGVKASGATGAYFYDTDSGTYAYIAYGSYGISSNGTKNFIEEHPNDPDKVIVYASLEGGEAGTYYRGTAQLTDGTAVVEVPEHFSLVTEDEGLTVQVTPRADCKGLYVAEVTTSSIVVKELQGGTSNARFDFMINGIRTGYMDYKVINTRAELGLDEAEAMQIEREEAIAERELKQEQQAAEEAERKLRREERAAAQKEKLEKLQEQE